MKKTQLIRKFILLMAFTSFLTAIQAQIKVSGVVMDASDNQPIVGATVIEIGTKKGTVTDLNGKYNITVEGPKSRLLFSYIGKQKVSVLVGNQTDISLSLADDSKNLDEVVVIGYGSVKKSDLTGSVSSMRTKDLEDSKASSFTSALSGHIAGVSAIQNGGAPGSGIDIKIRGASSISASSKPLYVIDGIMMENSDLEINAAKRQGESTLDPMAMINPDDIQSIEVLKDASATAIYGSRGANGVVLITTKSGSTNGTTSMNFSADWGDDFRPEKRIDVLTGPQYEDYMALRNPLGSLFIPNVTPLTTTQLPYWNPDGTVLRSGVNRNWQDEIFHTAPTENYHFSIRGGSKQTSYSISTGYMNKDGIVKTSNMNRFTFGGTIDSQYNKYVKIGIRLSTSFVSNTGVISADAQTGNNLFVQMLIFRPNVTNAQMTDPTLSIDDPANLINNPVNNLNSIIQKTESRRIQGKAYVTITPIEGLIINSTFGGYTTDAKSKNFYPSTSGAGRLDGGRAVQGSSGIVNWQNENTATYNRIFNDDNKLTVMGGITFQRTTIDQLQATATQLQDESLGNESLQFGGLFTSTNSLVINSLMSYLGRVNYNYKDRYLLTGSIRADGSSKFAKGEKFSYFPSAAFAWKVNEEKFMKDIKKINLLKLRLSYGVTGNQNIPALSGTALMNKTYYDYNTAQGSTGSPVLVNAMNLGTIGNDNLKWETTSQYNAGIDLLLFNSRINLTTDIYYKKTYDLLILEQLPGISGYVSQYRNVGSVDNKGVEVSLSTVNIQNKKFTWNTDFNISLNRNRVINVGNGDRIPATPAALMQGKYTDVFYVREGYPIGAMFGYQTDGLYQCKDFTQFYDANGKFISDPILQKNIYTNTTNFTLMPGVVSRGDAVKPGYVKLKSQSGAATINSQTDRVYLGSSEPLFFGGFTNRFAYQGFELSVFLQFSYGNKLFNTNHAMTRGYSTYNVETDYYNNMWLIDRQNGKYFNYSDINGAGYATDLQAEDASYIKIKDVTLSYKLPKNIVSKLLIKGARLYVSGKNLFTFTKYTWYDPEYSSVNPLSAGVDKYAYPAARTVMGGVSINL